MLFKRRLVQFSDGSYGVRTYWLFGWYFLDFACPQFSWKVGDRFFYDCKTKDKDEAIASISAYRLIGV